MDGGSKNKKAPVTERYVIKKNLNLKIIKIVPKLLNFKMKKKNI